ncbi:MAG TPA: ABC transporter substrate-binding protein [Gaiellaceae bacterium]|nr:ABC transporter substrate-binding protein [Gaiellaceae bacterium]
MARGAALAAAVAVSLLAVAGAGGAGAQTPKRGGTVVIAAPAHFEPACLNPLVDSCSPRFLDGVLAGAYEVMPAATYRPDLASGKVAARQPFTLLYRIRPEARWSDGARVTAGDFEFTHQAILRLRPELQDVHLDMVRSVRALDAKTVRVVLRAPFADWRELFPWVLPRHALAGQDLRSLWQNAIDNPKTGAPIGSGPFLVDRLDRGGRQFVLRRNPRYWGPHLAYLDRIAHHFIRPEDVADALRQGEVDMIDPGPRLLQAVALELHQERAPGIRVLPVLDSSWEHFDIRMGSGGHPALRIRLVRQALAYGIDREEIARVIGELTGGRDARPEPLDSVVFLANSRYYQSNWRGYRYRPEQARRLLERGGCRRGADSIYICAGERLSLHLVTSAGAEHRRRSAELAKAQLRRVGVEVILGFVPPTLLGTALSGGDFDLFQFGWIGGASTSGPADVFGCQQPSNFTGYCDRLVTRDLDQATRILDDQRRVRLLNKVDARLATAVPAIPLYQTTSLFAFNATVRGVVRNGVGRFTWNAEDWWLER